MQNQQMLGVGRSKKGRSKKNEPNDYTQPASFWRDSLFSIAKPQSADYFTVSVNRHSVGLSDFLKTWVRKDSEGWNDAD